MPYIQQAESQLTQDQSQLLGKLKAYSNYGLNMPKLDLFIPKNQQISLFDFIKKIFNSIGGEAMFQNLLKTFITKLLDKGNNLLEKQIVKALVGSLDKQNISISPGVSNQNWLTQNILPLMNIAKDQILALILGFIFGPPSLMSELIDKFNSKNNIAAQPSDPDKLLQMAVCSQLMYTVSNLPNQGVGDLEYQKLQLTNQLTSGGIVFEISCQQVVIQMPKTVLGSIVPVATSIPGTSQSSFNAANSISSLDNWIQTEIARQNIPENKSSASKSFFEDFIEKILNLITTAVMQQLDPVVDLIYQFGNPVKIVTDKLLGTQTSTSVTKEELKSSTFGSPCDIYSLGLQSMQGDANASSKKDQLSAFMSILLNAVLGILLAILLSELIKQVKNLLKRILAKKAADLAQRLIKKRIQQFEDFTGNISAEAARAAKLARALAELQPILQLLK